MESMDLKHKIRQQGEYNEYISECLDCDYKTDYETTYHWNHAIGWFQVLGDWCMAWECPKCGAKWYHHDRDLSYYRHHLIHKRIKSDIND
jgi:hypothetical protein